MFNWALCTNVTGCTVLHTERSRELSQLANQTESDRPCVGWNEETNISKACEMTEQSSKPNKRDQGTSVSDCSILQMQKNCFHMFRNTFLWVDRYRVLFRRNHFKIRNQNQRIYVDSSSTQCTFLILPNLK